MDSINGGAATVWHRAAARGRGAPPAPAGAAHAEAVAQWVQSFLASIKRWTGGSSSLGTRRHLRGPGTLAQLTADGLTGPATGPTFSPVFAAPGTCVARGPPAAVRPRRPAAGAGASPLSSSSSPRRAATSTCSSCWHRPAGPRAHLGTRAPSPSSTSRCCCACSRPDASSRRSSSSLRRSCSAVPGLHAHDARHRRLALRPAGACGASCRRAPTRSSSARSSRRPTVAALVIDAGRQATAARHSAW